MSIHKFAKIRIPIDAGNPSIVRKEELCIKCGACRRVCEQEVAVGRMYDLESTDDKPICVHCGQCICACPANSLVERAEFQEVQKAIDDPDKIVIFNTSPSVRVGLGEEFGLEPGAFVEGKMVSALRALGADYVLDTNFAADLTIMEEATELVHRVKNGGVLPMFTSCSPGWIKFVETFYPQNIPNLSTCKSPQQMLGAVIKTYYAERKNLDPKNIYSVSVMPCTAKKFEASRPELGRDCYRDVDAVLTTRELAQLIRRFNLDFNVQPESADSPFGVRSSAGKIFGATGGVMEAAVRSAYHFMTGNELGDLKVEAVRGLAGIKEAHVNVAGIEVGVAVVNGLGNAQKLLEQINAGERKDIHFVEVMTCPGGCVGGGGQPYGTDIGKIKIRAQELYNIDDTATLRVSHANPEIIQIYKEYLGNPNSHKAHELLHTHYHQRETLT